MRLFRQTNIHLDADAVINEAFTLCAGPKGYILKSFILVSYAQNKTKSIGVSEAKSSCIWFVNGGIINSY